MNNSKEVVRLARWYRDDGALVHRDEAIFELETARANVDVPAPYDGVLRHLANVGDVIQTGDEVARIDPLP